jgi:hypothetical protein
MCHPLNSKFEKKIVVDSFIKMLLFFCDVNSYLANVRGM